MKDLNTRLLAGEIIMFENGEMNIAVVCHFTQGIEGFSINIDHNPSSYCKPLQLEPFHTSIGFASFEKNLIMLIDEWDLVEM